MAKIKALVIVESPTKAKTISKFLPKGFRVEASIGHIRDLPQSAAEIPAKYKGEEWARLGINVEDNFKPLFVTPKGKASIVRTLKTDLAEAETLYLATDEDREGESISWHLLDILKPKVPVKRMVFHEITKKAIEQALENPRDLNMDLVNAQETRRILDRLFGYTLSPLLWKKISYGLSAGRVQSPGLRLLVERELARCRFVPAEYWDLKARLSPEKGEQAFEAKLVELDGQKVAQGKDFDPETGELSAKSKAILLKGTEARALETRIQGKPWTVQSLQEKESRQRPAPPFITSTLQQEGNRKLGLSARETMRAAQRLYEEGWITYMRTDSPILSQEALGRARDTVRDLYGDSYLSEAPRQYSAKTQNAQEAHEAIRPSTDFTHPDLTGLSGREKSLYELIWKRTLASQMAEAHKATVNARIEVEDALFLASGVKILFPGFLRVYVEGKDDPESALDNKEVYLPELKEGQKLSLVQLEALEHLTKAPARYTEAALVQRLEKEGIGRPSTYATIITTLDDRGYILKKDGALAPTFTGMAVAQLLENHFPELVSYAFTSQMEDHLDEIAAGSRAKLAYLQEFYSGDSGLKNVVESTEARIPGDASRAVRLPQLPESLVVRIGKFGPYVSRTEADGEAVNASIPEDITPADLKAQDVELLLKQQKEGPAPLGQDPETGKNIYVLSGRFGPHLQLGEKPQSKDEPKPRTVSLPKGLGLADVTMETALRLLALPRNLGKHPEKGEDVIANNGRFGPYVGCDGDFRSLKKEDDVYTITLERALELLAEEKKGRGGQKSLKDYGTVQGKKLQLLDGRYGPYLKWGATNISLKADIKERATELSEEELATLLKEKAGTKGRKKGK